MAGLGAPPGRRGEPYPPAYPSSRPDPGGDSLSVSGITRERGGTAAAPVPSPLPSRDCSGPAPRGIAGPTKLELRRAAPPSPSPGTRGAGGDPGPAGALRAAGNGQTRRRRGSTTLTDCGAGSRDRVPSANCRRGGRSRPGLRGRLSPGLLCTAGRGQVGMGTLPPSQPRRGAPAVTWLRPGRAGAPRVLPGLDRSEARGLASGPPLPQARTRPGRQLWEARRPRSGPPRTDCSGADGGPGAGPWSGTGRGLGRCPVAVPVPAGGNRAQGRGVARPLSAATRGKHSGPGAGHRPRREQREAAASPAPAQPRR